MGETVKAIMGYLNSVAGQNVTLDDMTDALGMEKRSVNGSLNALVRKGLCARTTATVEAPVTVKYLVLTADGLAVDPTADAE
jgi:predicted transcriptional regulator